MTEDQARRGIAWNIEATGVATEVSREPHLYGLHPRTRSKLADELKVVLHGKAVGESGMKASLDLSRIAGGASAVGWARQLLRTAVNSKLRDILSADHELSYSTLNDEEAVADEGGTIFDQVKNELSAEESFDDNRFAASFEALAGLKSLRHTGKTKQNAHHLRAAYEITAPIVTPEDEIDREWVQAQLEADETIAYRSLTQWLAIVTSQGRQQNPIDDRLLGLWDDFTADQAEDLAEYRPGFAHTIALAAVMLSPKPSRDIVNQAVKLVTMASGSEEWESHAPALVQAWVARECSPFSEFKSKTRGDENEQLAQHKMAAAAWPELARAAAGWHKTPLGSTVDEVRDRIARVFSSVDPANFPL
ncbi:hypothetical protein ACFVAJ_16720 [Agromyces sp. NPDC057679]|uniref:hypothetical protein n=1 Tax=Agromyces sp. NPDC057679 TaxID=3346207 RepID=UPI00367270AB